MVGILIFNGGRPDIALENGALYGGLHCGTAFNITMGDGLMSAWNIWMAGFWFMAGCTGKLSTVRRSEFRRVSRRDGLTASQSIPRLSQ